MHHSPTLFDTNSAGDRKRFNIIRTKLLKQGYEETAILESLVATSLVDDRAAVKWLVNHSDDPSSKTPNPRQYHLYLCPTNELEIKFEEFWSNYRSIRGWCTSMEFMPHVSVVEPFPAMACNFLDICHAFNTVSRFYTERLMPDRLHPKLLQSTISDSHLGFVLDEPNECRAIKEIGDVFAEILRRAGLKIIARKQPFRMSLCCEFQQTQYPQIQREIIEHFGLNDQLSFASSWQLRLYSRDIRLMDGVTNQLHPVYRMLCDRPLSEFTSHQMNFCHGDRIALIGSCSPPLHGWGLGFNCDTGTYGAFPLLATQRVSNYSAWTLHKAANINYNKQDLPLGCSLNSSCITKCSNGGKRENSRKSDQYDFHLCSQTCSASVLNKDTRQMNGSEPAAMQETCRTSLQVHVMRHAETVRAALGECYLPARANNGKVGEGVKDLNIPDSFPAAPITDLIDPPLSVIGSFTAEQIGQSLCAADVRYSSCYCSPAISCVQTARCILHACKQPDLPLRIEPMLYESESSSGQAGLSAQQLKSLGFMIDFSYTPASDCGNHSASDDAQSQLRKVSTALNYILKSGMHSVGRVLVVGHKLTVQHSACALIRRSSSSKRCLTIPHAAMLCFEFKDSKGWSASSNPTVAFTIKQHSHFDAAQLLTQ